MNFFALSPINKLALATVAAGLALAAAPATAQNEIPNAGRLGYVSGNVSVEPAGVNSWGAAYPNLPVGPGDRIFTDAGGRAELQLGQTYLRIGPNTDISVNRFDPQSISFVLAQGSIHVHSFGIWQGQAMQVSTPNANITAFSSSELRIDTAPDQSNTIFTSFGPETLITNPSGFSEHLENGQSLEIAGTNPIYPQWLAPAPDDLDGWSSQRDRQIANAVSLRYVSPYIPGAVELDAAGDWTPGTPYGAAWFPRGLPAGWAPYHYGHWVNRAPWGWTWVEDEPWGYAPFHYGRWVSIGGRWGWIPGPPAARPIYAPALVVFAGGIQVGGVGVSAWFPLGPGEPYKPWYPCPPHYVDEVNISNITETNVVHVQKTYVNIVNVTNVTNITYVNRTTAVTAVSQSDFAAGRPAARAAVKVAPQQMEHVTVVNNITNVVKPTQEATVGRAPARPVPVAAARVSVAAIQKKPSTAPPPQPPAGRKPVAAPAGSKTQNAVAKAPGEPGKPATAAGKAAAPAAAPAKAEGKPAPPAARPDARPAVPAKAPEAKPAPADRPAAKPAPEEAKPAARPGASPAHPETKPAPPAARPEAKPAAPGARSEAKPDTTKPGEKPAKPGTKPEDKNKKPPEKKPEDQKPE